MVEAHVVADFMHPRVRLRIAQQHARDMVCRILMARRDFIERIQTRQAAIAAGLRSGRDDHIRAIAVAQIEEAAVFIPQPFALAENLRNRAASAIDAMDADHAKPEIRIHVCRAEDLVHLRRRLGGIDFERTRPVPGALVRFDIRLAGVS